jgi:hypothetical protein
MGSARFGFSTSPRKQSKSGAKPLDEDSDLDLVVVSAPLFQSALESFATFTFAGLRAHADLKSDVISVEQVVKVKKGFALSLRRRAKALFYGYVSPSDLENGTSEKQRLYDMQREAATQLFGTAPPGPINHIGTRIYRDWDAAERQYEFSLMTLANVMGVAVHDTSHETEEEDDDPAEDASAA